MSRTSSMPKSRVSNIGAANRPSSKDENEKSMWSSMLDSVASGKRLPEKNLLVLGGSPQIQREFLETLASDVPKRPQDRYKKKPPTANNFALGYTYQDILDADHEDILARLSIFLMSDSSPGFSTLLKPLLTPTFIQESLIVILLDWSEPWSWVRQLRRWIALVLDAAKSLAAEADEVSEQVMKEWQQRKRGSLGYDSSATGASSDVDVNLPLGEGEWDLPLGLPLAVVCHNTDKIASLEIDQSWREEDFDFVLQTLRTILLKHGSSLIYTSNASANSLPALVRSSLDIHSSLKQQVLKHNMIDREKILIPPNWDSFGKIRVLREGFDVEKFSSLWVKDLSSEEAQIANKPLDDQALQVGKAQEAEQDQESVQHIYESTIKDPSKHRSGVRATPSVEVSIPPHQDFLATQLSIIDKLKADEAKNPNTIETSSTASRTGNVNANASGVGSTMDRMNEQIGPVQVNMGGIQVDASDALRRLKLGGARDSPSASGGSGHTRVTSADVSADPATPGGTTTSAMATPEREMKAQNEALNNFFTGLMKRGASGSPRGTPGTQDGKKGTPRAEKSREDGNTPAGRRLFGKE